MISPNPGSNLERPKSTSAQAATKYFASFRGLNLSVLKTLTDLIEKDAFINLSKYLDHIQARYDQHRTQIRSEYERGGSSTDQKDQVISTPTNHPPMTTTPFSFHTNGAEKASEYKLVSTNSSFPFQAHSQTLPNNDNNTKVSPFAIPHGSTAHDLKTVAPRNPFAMAAPLRPSPLRYENENVPAGGPVNESSDSTSKTKSTVTPISDVKPAASLFSNPNAVTQKSKPEEKSVDSPTASNGLENKSPSLFGTPPTSTSSPSVFSTPKPFSFVSPQSSVNKPPSVGFGFGVSSATNGSVFGGFGATKTSITQATPPKNGFNPVGFSFGNSPPTSTFPSQIADPAPSEKEKSSNNDVDPSGSSTIVKVENPDASETTEQSSIIPVSSKGEEDEETLYETSGRVYALMNKKQEDGSIGKGWVGWAVCNVKLNRHKDTKKTRILARSQVNQGILINFFVRPDLKPENRGSSIEILGFNPEGTQLQAYRIRPSSEAVVAEFINAINKVVRSLS